MSGETTGDWGQQGQWGHQCTFNCRLSRLCVIVLILELIISQLCSSQEIREINGRRAKTCLTFRINGSCHQLSLSPQNGLSGPAFMKSIYNTYDIPVARDNYETLSGDITPCAGYERCKAWMKKWYLCDDTP